MYDTLKFHVMSKRPDFNAIDMSRVGAHQEGNATGALGSVDPVGQQQQELTDAQRKSIMSQFDEWAQRLNIEGGKHQIWLPEVEAFDCNKESDSQIFRNNRVLTRKWVVEDLCHTYYFHPRLCIPNEKPPRTWCQG